jgi:hypothetical protein
VARVSRLLTFVDLADDDDGRMSVTALHEAELADGRRVVLLDDRGWSGELSAHATVEDIEQTARDVVGPDEPFEGRTQEDMAASHWAALAGVLQGQGVEVEGAALEALPHDVELSDRVRARIG